MSGRSSARLPNREFVPRRATYPQELWSMREMFALANLQVSFAPNFGCRMRCPKVRPDRTVRRQVRAHCHDRRLSAYPL